MGYRGFREWKLLSETDKLTYLLTQVDWRDIRSDECRHLLEREVDFTHLTTADQQRLLSPSEKLITPGEIAYGMSPSSLKADMERVGNERLPSPGDIANDRGLDLEPKTRDRETDNARRAQVHHREHDDGIKR